MQKAQSIIHMDAKSPEAGPSQHTAILQHTKYISVHQRLLALNEHGNIFETSHLFIVWHIKEKNILLNKAVIILNYQLEFLLSLRFSLSLSG